MFGGSPAIMAALVLVASPALAYTADARSAGCTWKDVQSPFFSGQLYGVTALSGADAWSVGYDTDGPLLNTAVIEHWNGTRWKVTPSPQPGTYRDFLEKVSAAASNDVWAVGGFQSYRSQQHQRVWRQHTLAEHWDGSAWTVVASPNLPGADNVLFGLVAISTDDVWAVGTATSPDGPTRALSEHWDGRTWTIVRTPDAGAYSNVLGSVDVVSPNDVWAVGSFSDERFGLAQTLTEHWNGARWRVVPSPNIGALGDGFRGVAAISHGDVWAAGLYGYHAPDGSLLTGTMTQHWNGKRWSVIDTPDPPGGDSLLNGITALATDEVWAVGYSVGGPIVIRWNGTGWIPLDGPTGGSRSLWSVAGLSPRHLWAVGSFNREFLVMRGC
jgi:hypothetical protein